jgi:hypothetical protein
MAKRGRKKHHDQPEQWQVSIPSSIAEPIADLLMDPLSKKIAYGARAKLVTKLLKRWLREEQTKMKAMNIDLDSLDDEM